MLPKQIIFLTPGFPKDESDTSCIPALQDFVLGWKEFHPEIELKVIAFQYPFKRKNYRWHGIEVYSARGANRKSWLRYRTLYRYMKKLKQWIAPDTVLISYFLTECALVAQICKDAAHHIAIAAGQDVLAEKNPYWQHLKRDQLFITCFNDKMSKALYETSGRGANFIIPFGLREADFEHASILQRVTDVLVVGSLIEVKRVEVALKVLCEVSKEISLRAEIIGEGTEEKKLKKLRDTFSLHNTVSFCGEHSREEVFKKMRQSKILLHTSSYEGQSTVISEALACGMTVICFDVGRIGDHEKVLVCPNEEEMIASMKNLLTKNQFDFTPAIPVTMKETIDQYFQVIQSF